MKRELSHGSSRFLAKPLSGSTGFLSQVFLATRKGDPRRYILKVGSDLPARRVWARTLRVFSRELAANRLLAPMRGKLSPRLHAGTSIESGANGLLLFDEIRHARNSDQLQGLGWTDLITVARGIAQIHAKFWNTPTLQRSHDLPLHHYMLAHQVRRHLPKFLRWAKLSQKNRDLFQNLPRHVDAALARLKKGPFTLVHGDFRSDNIFLGKGFVKFIDWALASRGSGAFDLARLAGASPKKLLHLQQHVNLLKVWHGELLRHGVQNYPLHQAWQDYQDAILLTLTIPVTNGPTLASLSSRGHLLAKVMTKRFIASAREIGIL